MSSVPGNGGIVVTKEMLDILNQPGHLSIQKGGQRLRTLYQRQSLSFDPHLLTDFGRRCYTSQLDVVRKDVEAGRAPDLTGAETAFKIPYVSLVVLGAQRITPFPGTPPLDHIGVVKYLISCGAPVDAQDIVGLTALHIATFGHAVTLDIARALLESGANVNHQDRYGSVPIFSPMQTNNIPAVELLLEFGADLNIAEADNLTPQSLCLRCGPQVTAVFQKWKRRRAGEEAPREEKKCGNCGIAAPEGARLPQCSQCHTMLYCSRNCQRAHWKTHKPHCQSFSDLSNVVIIKPYYDSIGPNSSYTTTIPLADTVRQGLGLATDANSSRHNKAATLKTDPVITPLRSIVIKVQVPITGTGDLLVYTKKRDLVCIIRREDNQEGYARIADVVRVKGVGGLKAYFAAELKSRDELVVKVSEVLAEQPF